MSKESFALIWPIIYNGLLVVLAIYLLANIKGRKSKKALLVSILSLFVIVCLSISTVVINLYLARNTGSGMDSARLIATYSLPTFFIIFALLSTIFRDRHDYVLFQNLRLSFIILATCLIYGSMFYAISS